MSLRKPYTEVFLHLVWGTWRRHGFITADLRERLYASMIHHATELGADVVALGGMPDHVHLLVRMPMTISIAEFVRRVKGGSSHFVTHVLGWPEPFKWQGGYGAFSVSRRNLAAARAYVLDQERHHADGTLHPTFERSDD